jgi:hypothetical protein
MIRTGTPPIEPDETLRMMKTIMAGRRALAEDRSVALDDVEVASPVP